VTTDLPAHVVTIHLRQHKIQDHEVRLSFLNETITVFAVPCRQHIVGLRTQRGLQSTEDRRVVFDHYDAIHERALYSDRERQL
jgi:hypothetical protein